MKGVLYLLFLDDLVLAVPAADCAVEAESPEAVFAPAASAVANSFGLLAAVVAFGDSRDGVLFELG